MILGMTWRMIAFQALVTAGVLYLGNTLSAGNPSVARVFRRNGIRVVSTANGGVAV